MNEPEMLYLSREDVVRAGVPMVEILQAVEAMFREKGEGRTEMPPKTSIHPRPDAFINAMPAYLPKMRAAGMKWVSSFPDNIRRGLPLISALLILNDPETGLPLALMDATWITAQRTGAASAIAAKYLARPEASTLGVVGCGVQGFSHAEALRCLFALRRIKAFDLRPEASAAFARKVEEAFGIEVTLAASAETAVRDSDLIVTAGLIRKNPDPFIREEWFAPGAFASAVDYDSAWTGAAMRAADVFVTDDTAQIRAHQGHGYFREAPSRIVELADVVAGRVPGRTRWEERTLAMNLGIALDDVAVGPLVLAKARAAGLGVRLPL
jgi:ornithine cyclodeaminase/alanine dehydrogenase-like protein (mu-crystallin family)